MGDEKPFEPVHKTRPGDEVLRRKRQPRARLRVAPRIPEVVRAISTILTHTPFVPMISFAAVLLLIFSTCIYFAEVGAPGSGIAHYSEALWWGVVAMTTMGTAPMPVTGAGQIVGGIWAIVGCLIFYGTIIASVTTYFMRRRETPSKQIVATVQYNLGIIDELTIEELQVLKDTAANVIDAQMGRLKEEQQDEG